MIGLLVLLTVVTFSLCATIILFVVAGRREWPAWVETAMFIASLLFLGCFAALVMTVIIIATYASRS